MSGFLAKKIEVNGVVQGVGFRPFVFQSARKHDLCGQVANTATGVVIYAEGAPESMAAFLSDLENHHPPLAHIVEMAVQEASPGGLEGFTIVKSVGGQQRTTLISPDVAVCDDCRVEMFDPQDRRFGYPFINCTNCGPRYTIIDDIPYDRPKTAMRHFTMCPSCRAEYENPNSRRFHAQPNACPQCGPQVSLHANRNTRVETGDPIAQCAQWIKDGCIIAIKGLGGFHLCVDALNEPAVDRLRQRKHREEKPLAVMSGDVETISTYAHVTPEENELLTSIQRPIVLLAKKKPEKLAFSVAPRNQYYGVMLPYTPLHYLLLHQGFTALVMTSGNVSEEPICIDNDDAFDRLKDIADYFLLHDRDIYLRSDDTIVRLAGHEMRQIRRSRGYVPIPIFLRSEMPSVLACGAELKNTVCLTKGRQAFVSQHIGDLENLATEQFFQLTIDHLKRILDISPAQVVCDLHPDYLSTQWAKSRHGAASLQVQHHFAHVASCMAENRLEAPVIGLAFDGTGYGPDGTIWGGELLVADLAGYRRIAHLEAAPMPGGAAAIKAPIRMALAYLHHVYGNGLWDLGLPAIEAMDQHQVEVIVQMCRQRINAPMTSSLGRLFDGVAAIVGLRRTVAFEGQAAMELEMMAQDPADDDYDFEWQTVKEVKQIALGPIIKGVVHDVQIGMPAFIIGRKFHNTIIKGCAQLCGALSKLYQLNQVALSGGCFQNRLLLEGLTEALSHKGMEVFSHRLVPSNDGGISLGQAVIGGVLAAGKKSRVTG
jgi:hydrogenase maturation protein HypF